MGDRGEHAADFAVLAFGEPHGQVGLLAAGLAQDDFFRLELFSRVQQSPAEPLQVLLRHFAAHGDQVSPADLAGGIGKPIGQARIVGQEQESGGRPIQSPHRDQVQSGLGNERKDRGPPLFVRACGDHAARLVQQESPVSRLGDGFSFDLDAGALWNDREKRVFPENPAHFHLAVHDPLACYRTGSDTQL